MLAGLKTVASEGSSIFAGVTPASRKFVREEVALAHISSAQAHVLIENLYTQLEKQGIQVDRLDDETVYNLSVESAVEEKQMVKELKLSEREKRAAERKEKRQAKREEAKEKWDEMTAAKQEEAPVYAQPQAQAQQQQPAQATAFDGQQREVVNG